MEKNNNLIFILVGIAVLIGLAGGGYFLFASTDSAKTLAIINTQTFIGQATCPSGYTCTAIPWMDATQRQDTETPIVRLRCGDGWFSYDASNPWLSSSGSLTYYSHTGNGLAGYDSLGRDATDYCYVRDSFNIMKNPDGTDACCPNGYCMYKEISHTRPGTSICGSTPVFPNGVVLYGNKYSTDKINEIFTPQLAPNGLYTTTTPQPGAYPDGELKSGSYSSYSAFGTVYLDTSSGSSSKCTISYSSTTTGKAKVLCTSPALSSIAMTGGDKLRIVSQSGTEGRIDLSMTEIPTGCTTPTGKTIPLNKKTCDGDILHTCNSLGAISGSTDCSKNTNGKGIYQVCVQSTTGGECKYDGCDTTNSATNVGILAPGSNACYAGITLVSCSDSKALTTQSCGSTTTQKCVLASNGIDSMCKAKGCTVNGNFYTPGTSACKGTDKKTLEGCTAAEVAVTDTCTASEVCVASGSGSCQTATQVTLNGYAAPAGQDSGAVVEGGDPLTVVVNVASGLVSSDLQVVAEITDATGKKVGNFDSSFNRLTRREFKLNTPTAIGAYYIKITVGTLPSTLHGFSTVGTTTITLSTCDPTGVCSDTQYTNNPVYIRGEVLKAGVGRDVDEVVWSAHLALANKDLYESQGEIVKKRIGTGIYEANINVPAADDTLKVRMKVRTGTLWSDWSEEKQITVVRAGSKIKLINQQWDATRNGGVPNDMPLNSYTIKFTFTDEGGQMIDASNVKVTMNTPEGSKQISVGSPVNKQYSFSYAFTTAYQYSLYIEADTAFGTTSLNSGRGEAINILGPGGGDNSWFLYAIGAVVALGVGYMIWTVVKKK